MVLAAGTATQSVSGGDVQLSPISGGHGYADNGFYVPLGTLAPWRRAGTPSRAPGRDFGTNVYFDVNNDGEFFGWTSNYLSSIAPDTYGLGPTSVGGHPGGHRLLDVRHDLQRRLRQLHACTTLATSWLHPKASPAATKVAVWVGITSTGACAQHHDHLGAVIV